MLEPKKPIVFVITPFNEDFLALYDELSRQFENDFEFTNAGDLDNQQSILKDIVQGIYKADVIIADLTGLNANVFYELGLAHAMNKKVIIITQDLSELPFDIKSYRANEYSLQFNKLPNLIIELKKLLTGAIDNSVQYGNPVCDYLPNYFTNVEVLGVNTSINVNEGSEDVEATEEESESDKGYLDYIADILENSNKMTTEISSMNTEMDEMTSSITSATNDINRATAKTGTTDAVFVRNVCRKLSKPIDTFSAKLKGHVSEVSICWDIVENSYLALLDNSFAQKKENFSELQDSIKNLTEMKSSIKYSHGEIANFVETLHNSLGMERHLNKSITILIKELESYLTISETMSSSIDRILAKNQTIINNMKRIEV